MRIEICEPFEIHLLVHRKDLNVMHLSQVTFQHSPYFQPMKSTLSLIGIILFLQVASAQNEVSMDLAQSIWSEQIPPPDPETLGEIEAKLIRLSTEENLECAAFQDELTAFAAILRQGAESKLYPGIFLNTPAQCPEWNPFVIFLIADAFYVQGDLDEATRFYRSAREKLEPDGEAHLTACLNSGACLIQLKQFSEAIEVYKEVINHPFAEAETYRYLAQINLSAAQLNAGFLRDALATIREIQVDDLNAYWRSVHFSNALIVYQKLGDYAGSDSIWHQHLSQIPFESIPGSIHKRALLEQLQEGDYYEFIRFRDHVMKTSDSPLRDPAHAHYPLFATDSTDANLMQLWDLYRDVEARRREDHLVFLEEVQPQLQAELRLIQDELGKARLSSRNWKLTSALIVLSIFSVLMTLLLMRSQRLRRHQQELLQPANGDALMDSRVDEDDLVILAQALTYGKGLQKALLIVRRLRVGLSKEPESRLNLENIEFYDELNEREKAVAEYIASGFSSKEIAQMLHVTPKYTYNIRSRIRAKLCVPDEEELMEWFRNAGLSEKP